MKKLVIVSTLLLAVCQNANATKVSPALGIGMDFGGDKLVDVTYTDGSKSDIEAGRGVLINGGIVIDISETEPHIFQTQLTLGWKFTTTKQASNGEISFYRWPVEVLSFYRNTEKNFRVGGGLTYQVGNELKGTKEAALLSTSFENAAGLVIEAGYFLGPERKVVLSARYTAISYKTQTSSSVNGSSLGIGATYIFP